MTAAPVQPEPQPIPAARPSLAGEPRRRGFNGMVAGFFSLAARAYDLGPLQYVMYRPPQDDVMALLRTRGSKVVVDVGCGTGILTSRIANDLPVQQVYGVDMSSGMLAQARRRSAKVKWRNEPAERIGLPSASVDAVVTTTAFHFFDQPRALAEFARIVKPGGVVAISALATSAALARPIQALSGSRIIPAHAPSLEEIREVVAGAGFRGIEQRSIRRPWYSRVVPDVLTVGQRL